ncbi:MAG: T9SS type A sorting domain-containing protein [Bacteroidetes bacterium]|nr:T9SS type A sorting domain-containing protein [Bacteroidota bacterium]
MRILLFISAFLLLAKVSFAQNCAVSVSLTINGSNINATATSTNATYPLYSWYDPATNSYTNLSPANTYNFTMPANGMFYSCVWIYDSLSQCSDSACFYVFQQSGCNASFYTFDSLNITFFVNTSIADSGNTFVWDFGDGGYSTDADPSYTYAQPGIYSVCLLILDSSQFPCDTLCQQLTVNYVAQTGLNEQSGLTGNVSLYPNPATGTATLRWEQNTTAPHKITILDLTGRTVYTALNTPYTTGQQLISLPLAELPGGVYLVKIENESGQQAVTRLTVQPE